MTSMQTIADYRTRSERVRLAASSFQQSAVELLADDRRQLADADDEDIADASIDICAHMGTVRATIAAIRRDLDRVEGEIETLGDQLVDRIITHLQKEQANAIV